MNKTETVYGRTAERVRLGDDPEAAADHVLRTARKVDLASFVRPLLVAYAGNCLRRRARGIEDTVHRMIERGDDPIAARAKLCEETFDLPGGRTVRWLDATADEHLERAAWQRRLAGTIVVDAERHEAAAAAIAEAGVSCLREIEGAAA